MNKLSVEVKNGILIFLGISIYFFIIKLLGASDNHYLKLFNVVFVIWGLNRTIREQIKRGETKFLKNFSSAVLTAFVGVFLSVVGLGVYLGLIQPDVSIESLADSILMPASSTSGVGQYCLALFVEGFTSSAIVGFILMQHYKYARELNMEIE